VIPANRGRLPAYAAVPLVKSAYAIAYEDESRRIEDVLPMLRLPRPNVLVVGGVPEADRMIERLRPYLRTPLTSWTPLEQPHPPTADGTLVIRGVETLNAAQQAHVLALNDRRLRDLQIVSIAGAPLFPLVRRGVFLDRLYYQLNVVYLDLTAAPRH
jgi:hypothetical protein